MLFISLQSETESKIVKVLSESNDAFTTLPQIAEALSEDDGYIAKAQAFYKLQADYRQKLSEIDAIIAQLKASHSDIHEANTDMAELFEDLEGITTEADFALVRWSQNLYF